ncbi:hypothetical protein EJB05_14069, partial [Eragrostis curvula]
MASPPPQSRKPSMASPAELVDALVEEVLLRFPLDDPSSLARAALVCKRWRHIVSGDGFRRRFSAFHRAAPMLGFLCNVKSGDGADIARFFPASSSCPRYADRRGDFALDARHGRVLLHCTRMAPPPQGFDPTVLDFIDLVVWDPNTGEEHQLPVLFWHTGSIAWNAAVLCALGSACDHLDCHHGPYLVVFVGTNHSRTSVFVYSSEAGAWSAPVSGLLGLSNLMVGPSLLARDRLHFTVENGLKVLMYDLARGRATVVPTPSHVIQLLPVANMSLLTLENGELGVTGVVGYNLYLWSWRDCTETIYGGWWEQPRVIQLDTLLSIDPHEAPPTFLVVGFAEGARTIFIGTGNAGVFTVEMNSGRVKKVLEIGPFYGIVPYVSFYTPCVLGT